MAKGSAFPLSCRVLRGSQQSFASRDPQPLYPQTLGRRPATMRRIGYNSLAVAVLAIGLLASTMAFAQGDGRTCPGNTPVPNGAIIDLRLFNDCPTSTANGPNLWPASLTRRDPAVDCFGGAHGHT